MSGGKYVEIKTKQLTVALSVVVSHILRYVIYVCSIVKEPSIGKAICEQKPTFLFTRNSFFVP